MKKILALILVLLMAVSVLAACGEREEEKKKKSNTDTTQVDTASSDESVSTDVPTGTDAPTSEVTPTSPSFGDKPDSLITTITQEELLGTWEMTMYMEEAMKSGYIDELIGDLGTDFPTEAFEDIFSDLTMTQKVVFKDDGTYATIMNETVYKEFMGKVFDNMLEWMRNGGYAEMLEKQGATMEDFEEQLAAQGMTTDQFFDLLDAQLKSAVNTLNMEEMNDDAVSLGGGDYLKDNGYEYELKGGILFMDDDADDEYNENVYYTFDGTDTITILKDTDGNNSPYTGTVLKKLSSDYSIAG